MGDAAEEREPETRKDEQEEAGNVSSSRGNNSREIYGRASWIKLSAVIWSQDFLGFGFSRLVDGRKERIRDFGRIDFAAEPNDFSPFVYSYGIGISKP